MYRYCKVWRSSAYAESYLDEDEEEGREREREMREEKERAADLVESEKTGYNKTKKKSLAWHGDRKKQRL